MQLEFNIKTILTNASIAAKYCDEIIRSEGLSMTAKKFFKDIERKLMSVERDVCSIIDPEMATIIRKEISDNWETLSFHNINTLLQAMTDEQRIKVETYCTNLLNEKPIEMSHEQLTQRIADAQDYQQLLDISHYVEREYEGDKTELRKLIDAKFKPDLDDYPLGK